MRLFGFCNLIKKGSHLMKGDSGAFRISHTRIKVQLKTKRGGLHFFPAI